jgi:DNA-binding SARP family transcriptional activator
VAVAQQLLGRLRSLKERYADERQRLRQALESLDRQRRDLDRDLVTIGRLTNSLGSGPVAALTAHHEEAESGRAAVLEQEPFSGLEVRCLGAFEVRYRGQAIDVGKSHNGRLMFKYLVTRPSKRASKEVLAELFWPDVEIERGLANLQSALHQLKRAMGRGDREFGANPAIIYADDHYFLNPELDLRCDVDSFRRRLATARSCDARGDAEGACHAYLLSHEAYGGELLPEERYEDWVAADRRGLEADHLAALARLVRLHLAREEHDQAERFGQLLLEVDPTREDVHRDLMRSYSRTGRRGDAIRQYRQCYKALQKELELLPEAETTLLFERVVTGEAI